MNILTFKKMCLKAGTKKADEIHDYFINNKKRNITTAESIIETAKRNIRCAK